MTDRLSWIVLFFLFVILIIIVWGIVLLHSYPGKVAERRGHPQKSAIDAMSVMGLLIFPLWMFALIWAYMRPVAMPVKLEDVPPDPNEKKSDEENTGDEENKDR
jgi:hypothetical protein